MKRIGFGIALLLTLVAVPTFAQANPVWTAVASTGVIDEAALGYFAFGTTNLGYKNAVLQPIVARYNVVNIAGFANPAWTTLELGYFDNSNNSQLSASLWEVNPCTGVQALKCNVVSVNANAPTCATCQFAGIDFVNFLYYVELTIQRNANVNVQANTLRIW